MRHESVFRVGCFVQMRAAFQIKFTSSVAGALHRPDPKLEQILAPRRLGQRPIFR
jgi:hypothetical protein